jgi:hypothetical protein
MFFRYGCVRHLTAIFSSVTTILADSDNFLYAKACMLTKY